MKVSLKHQVFHGVMLLSLAAPILSYSVPAFAQAPGPGQKNDPKGGAPGAGGGNGGGQKPPVQQAPSQPNPQPQPQPQPPGPVGGPPPGGPGREGPGREGPGGPPGRPAPRPDRGNGAAVAAVVGVEAGVEIIGWIAQAVHDKRAKETKTYDWRLSSDLQQVYCFGINQYLEPATDQPSVSDDKCSAIPYPVTYKMEAASDGSTDCFEFYNRPSDPQNDGNELNNGDALPADQAITYCGQAPRGPFTPEESAANTQALLLKAQQMIDAYNQANPPQSPPPQN